MKINYKGSNAPRDWEYVCDDCRTHTIISHGRQEDMQHRKCDGCGGDLLRYIGKAPTLGAEYHDSLKSRNLGWSLDGELR